MVLAIEKNPKEKNIFSKHLSCLRRYQKSYLRDFSTWTEKSLCASKLAMEFICNNTATRNEIIFTRLFNCIGIGQKESFFIPKILKAHIKKEPVIHLGRMETKENLTMFVGLLKLYEVLLK